MCGNSPPARTSDLPRPRGSITALLATPFLRPGVRGTSLNPPDNQPQGTTMINNLREKLFGSRANRDATATTLKKEQTLAKINEPDTGSVKPRTRRTLGLTEANVRAANEQSWLTSSKGWSNLFGRFTR